MATSHTYLFNNMSRIGGDNCSTTQVATINKKHENYMTNNYNLHRCGMNQPISFATKQPNLFYKGGTGSNVGIGGCAVDDNSKLTIGQISTNPKCRITLQQRPFLTVPLLIKGKPKPNLESALNDSLKRLKTDYIDLYQLHWPERNVNNFGRLGYVHEENEWNKFEDVLAELNKYIDQGKIRYVGLSNETPWGVLNYLQLSKDKKLPRMMSIQNPYSLLNRSYEVGLAEVSIRENIGCLAYSPLASGYLSGKYRNKNFPKGSRMERDYDFWTRYRKPNTEDAVEHYYKISKKYDLDMSQMSIKFCEIQDFMTSVIIGATTMEQLKTNIESVNVNLSDDVIKEINQVQTIYPNPCP